ncbi:MAG: site-specific integrase [Candidatus Zixiibacteriota bacterium]|nr:MAG: site-specific integrase [candidate division Zixibacteria bacterium]
MANLFFKDGKWWLNYRVNGRRYRRSTRTANRKLAETMLKELEVKLFKGEDPDPKVTTTATSLPDFLRRFKEYYIGRNSGDIHGEISRLNIMQEFFARKNISSINKISPSIVDELFTVVLIDKKPKTKKNYLGLLKTAMNKAVEWNLIEKNPIANVKPPKVVKTFHFFNKKEIEQLLDNANEPLKTAIIILVNTGLRRTELFNLRWKDVDLKNKKIRVWPYDNFTPKGKRPRSIPISKSLQNVLVPLSKENPESEFVFRPYSHVHTIYKQFKDLLEKSGLRGSLHDLRHTFASHLAMAGVPIPVISELLGHSDITTTMIYAHLSPDSHQSAIAKLPF